MKPIEPLYLVCIGCGIDLLISKDEVLVNNYSDSTAQYDIFENTAYSVSNHCGGSIVEIELSDEHCTVVEEMFEDIDYRDPTQQGAEKAIAEYILKHGTAKK